MNKQLLKFINNNKKKAIISTIATVVLFLIILYFYNVNKLILNCEFVSGGKYYYQYKNTYNFKPTDSDARDKIIEINFLTKKVKVDNYSEFFEDRKNKMSLSIEANLVEWGASYLNDSLETFKLNRLNGRLDYFFLYSSAGQGRDTQTTSIFQCRKKNNLF
jgi:hypothetical protein